jgi:hypothetical protein
MLLDLGALVYELHRQGRRAPELLQQKAAELEVVDGEVRELEDTLAGLAPEDAVPAYHEDFDELDEEEFEQEEDESDLDEDEPIAGELDDEFEDVESAGEDELDEDDLEEDDLGDGGLDDDELDDPDATVEVDALDGLPDDREARS